MMRGLAGGKAVASPLPSTKVLCDRISPFKGPLATPFTAHRPNSRQWTKVLGNHYGCTPLQASLRDSGPLMPREPEIDPDLYAVLNMASDEELEELYSGLYDTSLLSPVGKSLQTATPPAVHYSGRDALIRRIERRFRFLAADPEATLRGQWPSYRDTLLSIHSRLGVPCSTGLATHDLEAEIFLFLLKEHADAVNAASPTSATAAEHADHGDGMASPRDSSSSSSSARPNVFQRALAPLKLGAKEVLPALTRLGATLALTNAQVNLARQLGTAFMRSSVQYEAAAQVAAAAGNVASKSAMRAAQKGLTAAASRYGAARSLLSVLGPIMWAATAIDLARMSIGCDYARIVKAVFALAQIRLLRTDGWATKSQYEME